MKWSNIFKNAKTHKVDMDDAPHVEIGTIDEEPGYSYNDDTPGYDPHAYPDCPLCNTVMGYSYVLDEFKCPSCGYIIDGDDYSGYNFYDSDGMPWACSTCGGPWPDCVDSCRLYDED